MKKMVLLLLATVLFFGACTQNAAQKTASNSAKSTGPTQVIHLAIWSNYVTPEILADFEKKTGIRVEISNYSTNDELLAKLQAGVSGYDVIAPSDYMVLVMSKMGLIQKLDLNQIPNTKNLDSRYLKKPFDPSNEYSVPYNSGTTGIAINRELYSGPIKGWNDVFSNPQLAGKFSLLDDAQEVIGVALKSMGYSMNSKDAEQLKKAKELLVKVRPAVKAFNSETLNPLVSREVAVAQAFVMDALYARKLSGGKIEFILPEEGSTFYIDNFSIPSTAAHVGAAHQFINFMLEAKNEALLASRLFLAPTNKQAVSFLPPAFQQENAILFPSGKAQDRLEMMEDLGEVTQTINRIWTDVKASNL